MNVNSVAGAAARIATAGRRAAANLARRGRTAPAAAEPAPTWHLHPTVCRALDATMVHERAGNKEEGSRVVVSVPGHAPFLAGETDATAEALRVRFPKELKNLDQARVAVRFLADAQKQRRREQRKSRSFVHNW